MKVAIKVFLLVKILLKLRFLECISKAKTEECDEKSSSVSDKFRINTTCSTSYRLEVNAPVSLKAVTAKHLLEVKKLFLKAKAEAATKKIEMT